MIRIIISCSDDQLNEYNGWIGRWVYYSVDFFFAEYARCFSLNISYFDLHIQSIFLGIQGEGNTVLFQIAFHGGGILLGYYELAWLHDDICQF